MVHVFGWGFPEDKLKHLEKNRSFRRTILLKTHFNCVNSFNPVEF